MGNSTLTFLILSVIYSLLTGCSAGVVRIPQQIVNDDTIASLSKKYQSAICENTIDTGCAKIGEPKKGSWLEIMNDCGSVTPTYTNCIKLRSIISNEMLLIIDHHYHAYEGGMLAGRAKTNFWAGSFRSTLEVAATLFNPASTVKILTGSAALTGTIHETADKEFYYDQTINALITQMRSDRKTILANLITGLKKPTYEEYSIESAIRDLNNYYRAGTFASATISLSKSTAETERTADMGLKEAKNPKKSQVKSNDGEL